MLLRNFVGILSGVWVLEHVVVSENSHLVSFQEFSVGQREQSLVSTLLHGIVKHNILELGWGRQSKSGIRLSNSDHLLHFLFVDVKWLS